MVATSTFWLTCLLAILATTGAAPVDSPVAPTIESLVYTPLETPSPEQRLKVCIAKCLLYLENTYPACHGRFTPEEYSPETFCHTFGYVCKHACSYEW